MANIDKKASKELKIMRYHSDEIKLITKTIVEKLSQLPLTEKIELENGKMIDSKGNVIITFPRN